MKKALITGASRGIGKGIALRLAKEGYDIAISYRSKENEALEIKREAEERYHVTCAVFQAELERPGAGQALFKKAADALDGISLLVNNAGTTIFENIFDMTEETLDFLIALDFKNYLMMTREAVRYMAAREIRGSVVNVTSSRGERAYPGDAVYGGLKAGLNRAIQSIALDAAPSGIRINNVAPGAIEIRSPEEILSDNELNGKVPLDFWKKLGERVPLGRSGRPEDIAEAVIFLASERASYITGVTLRVDGGLILPGMPEAESEEGRGWGYLPPGSVRTNEGQK